MDSDCFVKKAWLGNRLKLEKVNFENLRARLVKFRTEIGLFAIVGSGPLPGGAGHAPTPPVVRNPTPVVATPTPVRPTPAPVRPIPAPLRPAPEPVRPTPTPSPIRRTTAPTPPTTLSADSNDGTLIIGDSMSGGEFGKGLANLFSQRNQLSCQFSMSSSATTHWISGNFAGTTDPVLRIGRNGANVRSTLDPEKLDWSLYNLLQNPKNQGCPINHVKRLVVSLGSNGSPAPEKKLRSIVKMAHDAGVTEVDFLLPPGKRFKHDRFKTENEQAAAILDTIQNEPIARGVKVAYVNPTEKLNIDDDDFNVENPDDWTHFKDNKPTQKRWFSLVSEELFGQKLSVYHGDETPDLLEKLGKQSHTI